MARTEPFDKYVGEHGEWFEDHRFVYESELAAASMRNHSITPGLRAFEGTAENLPLQDESYDFALEVTTICFIDDAGKSFREAHRVLKAGGDFVLGFFDKENPLGKVCEKMKSQNKSYRYATFYSTAEVKTFLEQNEFGTVETVQTVFGELPRIRAVQQFREGHGEGGFVAMRAQKT